MAIINNWNLLNKYTLHRFCYFICLENNTMLARIGIEKQECHLQGRLHDRWARNYRKMSNITIKTEEIFGFSFLSYKYLTVEEKYLLQIGFNGRLIETEYSNITIYECATWCNRLK